MTINFTKLQATGNDFVLINARNMSLNWITLARNICNRHFGVGADGIILLLNSDRANFEMRILNADGSEAQICGNGLRCFAKYVIDHHLYNGTKLTISTLAGIKTINATLSGGKVVRAEVNMGRPIFNANEIPVTIGEGGTKRFTDSTKPILDYPLHLNGYDLLLSFVSMGNPHAVAFLSDTVADFPLAEVGPQIEHHPLFPEKTNFEIAHMINRNCIEVRVWERGAGETLACGSGACATAVISYLKGYANQEVDIMLTGGNLTISWDGTGDVFLNGPVSEVFSGQWPLDTN
jgi:diaminopimelate epimerase